MESGHSALVLLYALFWAAALAMTGRYQAFDTPSLWVGESRTRLRFLFGLVFLNVLPIAWLGFLMWVVVPDGKGPAPVVSAAISALSVFGFHRILHALIATDSTYSKFYTDEQIKQVRDRGAFVQPQTFSAHFWPGVIYIVGCGGLAWLVALRFS